MTGTVQLQWQRRLGSGTSKRRQEQRSSGCPSLEFLGGRGAAAIAAAAAEFQRRQNLPATTSLSTRVLFLSQRQIWRRETEARTAAMVAGLDGDDPSRGGSG
ncbi:uncharacterized protein DS421_17g577730 [Arachis hypogaea]|nr:uncharacterized protein DS421_17g577730 [Arachis hypogaea]